MEENKSIGQQSPQITKQLSKTASTRATPAQEETIEEVVQMVSLAESMEVRANQPPQNQPSQVLDQDHLEPKNQNEAEVVEPEQFNLPPPPVQV